MPRHRAIPVKLEPPPKRAKRPKGCGPTYLSERKILASLRRDEEIRETYVCPRSPVVPHGTWFCRGCRGRARPSRSRDGVSCDGCGGKPSE